MAHRVTEQYETLLTRENNKEQDSRRQLTNDIAFKVLEDQR